MDADTNKITELQSRITQLEIKLAYLENFIDELQEVTVQQNKNMDRLKAENQNMSEKIAEISEQFESDIPNRRPPHY